MFAEYKDNNKSEVADVKNSGGPKAGSINAAFFLREFVDDRPWAHLDVAGAARASSDDGGEPDQCSVQSGHLDHLG